MYQTSQESPASRSGRGSSAQRKSEDGKACPLAKRLLLRYNDIANLIKVLVRGNPLGLVQWEPMNLVRSERKQQ